MDDYPGVSLNELIFEIKDEEFTNTSKLTSEQKDIFPSQKIEDDKTSNENAFTEDFEDCNIDILSQSLFKNKDSSQNDDSDFECDFPEISHSTILKNSELPVAPISIKSVSDELILEDKLIEKEVDGSNTQDILTIKKENDSKDEQPGKTLLDSTAEEWDKIQTIQPEIVQADAFMKGSVAEFESKPLVTFIQIWPHFESCDYSSVKSQIKSTIERQGFYAFIHLLFGPPKLQRNLLPQRDLLFSIAATSFQNDNIVHNQILQTIYRCLTGSKFDCPRYGDHWEEIGFQGKDPATDLRGGGMLALLHILFLLRDSSTKELSRDIYKLSLHPIQNFPFCIMAINLTRICLQVLREEIFNKECNKRGDVIGTINCVYASLFLYLYNKWKKGKTIAESGFILQDTEQYARKHSRNVIKDFEESKKQNKHSSGLEESCEQLTFFSICKKEEENVKSNAELY